MQWVLIGAGLALISFLAGYIFGRHIIGFGEE